MILKRKEIRKDEGGNIHDYRHNVVTFTHKKFVLSMKKVTSIAICDYVALLEKQKGGGEE